MSMFLMAMVVLASAVEQKCQSPKERTSLWLAFGGHAGFVICEPATVITNSFCVQRYRDPSQRCVRTGHYHGFGISIGVEIAMHWQGARVSPYVAIRPAEGLELRLSVDLSTMKLAFAGWIWLADEEPLILRIAKLVRALQRPPPRLPLSDWMNLK